jgi:hypothetical protein
VTVNAFPAIVRVAVRDPLAVLAATVNAVVPLPVPLAPLVMVIQDTGLVAVQSPQPALAVTAALPVPPAAAID